MFSFLASWSPLNDGFVDNAVKHFLCLMGKKKKETKALPAVMREARPVLSKISFDVETNLITQIQRGNASRTEMRAGRGGASSTPLKTDLRVQNEDGGGGDKSGALKGQYH